MRILQVHNINQVPQIFAEDLRKRGHAVTIYEPDLTGGFAPLPLKMALMPRRILHMRHIVGKLNQKHFDIVHIHWASYGILGLLGQVPYVVHCHGSDVLAPTFRPILRPILKQAAAVIGITPNLIPMLQAINSNAYFLPGPIDTAIFIPSNPYQVTKSRLTTILLFSRLDPDKGSDIALKGITQFIEQYSDIQVKILDWGPDREKYKNRYGRIFEFIPVVAAKEVPHLLQTVDVVIGQFVAGVLGFSELQAMSCAKPVITAFSYQDSYATPPPLFCASNAQEIAEQLEYLFSHPDIAREVGLKAREWVIAYHSRQMLAERLEQLYLSIHGQ
jgi:glycosyltransferase involved in cell wall biosynthesis